MSLTQKGVTAHAHVLQEIAQLIWSHAQSTQQSPIVLTSTSGPIRQLRQQLEVTRPKEIKPEIAFLPKIISISDWLSQTLALLHFPPTRSDLERWEMVYGQLANHKKIQSQFGVMGEGGRWALAKDIVQACDFLTQSNIAFAIQTSSNLDRIYEQAQLEFERTLKKAYPAIDFGLAQEEGQLILAFWKYLSNTEDSLVRERMAYQYRQEELSQASPPLVWIDMAPPAQSLHLVQEQFLQAYATYQDVLKLSIDWQTSALWPECIDGLVHDFDVKTIEQVQKNRQARSSQDWRVIAQPSFESMAWAALNCILQHIQAQRNNIALVAQDRLVSRRIRALLARYGDQISIQDQTGWKLSTTSAAAAVNSFLQLLDERTGPSLVTLLGFLKNPLLDWSALIAPYQGHTEIDATEFSWWMERRLLASSVGFGWEELRAIFSNPALQIRNEPARQEYDEIAHHILSQIEQQCKLWHGVKNTSQIWGELLEKHLEECAMLAQLEQDEAGQSVLATLQQLKQLQTEYLSFSSWTSLFDLWVEQAAFVQKSQRQKTHIAMIPLAAIRLNHYDAVVVVGCDDRKLPSSQDYGSVFSRSMLHALDEKLPETHYIQQARDLSQLLSSHRYVDLLWQEYERAGEKNRLSSWLARLQQALPHIQGIPVVSTFGQVQNDQTKPSHAQVSDAALLPKKISPSAYQTLRSCPYRFYVSYMLNLKSPQALREQSEFGQIGNLLHVILQNFYQEYQKQTAWNDEQSQRFWMESALLKISQEQWGYLIAQNGQLFAEQQGWMAQIPGWVTWQLEQEKQGWQFAEAEKNITFTLQLESGELLPISGRVDRIDHNASNNLRVLDYKFKNGKDLKKFSETLADDPQVLIYSKALQNIHHERGHIVEQAGWVSVREAVGDQRDYLLDLTQEHFSELEEQMTQDLSKVWAGQDLPANGPDQVCQYCDARGLCRKGMW